jgi:hypothetical protein
MTFDVEPQCQSCFKPLADGSRLSWEICEECRAWEDQPQEADHEPFEVEDWVRFVLSNCRSFVQDSVTVGPYMFTWEEAGRTLIRPFPSLLTAATKEDMQQSARDFHAKYCPNPETHVAFLLGHFGQQGVQGRSERFVWFLTFTKNPVFQIIVTKSKENKHRVSYPVLMKPNEENPCT